jgi:hypothetical protein
MNYSLCGAAACFFQIWNDQTELVSEHVIASSFSFLELEPMNSIPNHVDVEALFLFFCRLAGLIWNGASRHGPD